MKKSARNIVPHGLYRDGTWRQRPGSTSSTTLPPFEGGSVVDEMDPQRILAEDVCEGAEKPARPPRSAPGAVVSEAGFGEWKANPLFRFTQSLTRDAMNR